MSLQKFNLKKSEEITTHYISALFFPSIIYLYMLQIYIQIHMQNDVTLSLTMV